MDCGTWQPTALAMDYSANFIGSGSGSGGSVINSLGSPIYPTIFSDLSSMSHLPQVTVVNTNDRPMLDSSQSVSVLDDSMPSLYNMLPHQLGFHTNQSSTESSGGLCGKSSMPSCYVMDPVGLGDQQLLLTVVNDAASNAEMDQQADFFQLTSFASTTNSHQPCQETELQSPPLQPHQQQHVVQPVGLGPLTTHTPHSADNNNNMNIPVISLVPSSSAYCQANQTQYEIKYSFSLADSSTIIESGGGGGVGDVVDVGGVCSVGSLEGQTETCYVAVPDLSQASNRRSSSISPTSVCSQSSSASNSELESPAIICERLSSVLRLCHVCSEPAGKHCYYGGQVCPSCRAFFRRTVQSRYDEIYKCAKSSNCIINRETRKTCQYCRFNRCLAAGLKRKWVLADGVERRKAPKKLLASHQPQQESNVCVQPSVWSNDCFQHRTGDWLRFQTLPDDLPDVYDVQATQEICDMLLMNGAVPTRIGESVYARIVDQCIRRLPDLGNMENWTRVDELVVMNFAISKIYVTTQNNTFDRQSAVSWLLSRLVGLSGWNQQSLYQIDHVSFLERLFKSFWTRHLDVAPSENGSTKTDHTYHGENGSSLRLDNVTDKLLASFCEISSHLRSLDWNHIQMLTTTLITETDEITSSLVSVIGGFQRTMSVHQMASVISILRQLVTIKHHIVQVQSVQQLLNARD